MFTFSSGSHCFNISYFNFRGYKGPRKLKTANIYPHVFEANPRKFGDAKIYHFTVSICLNEFMLIKNTAAIMKECLPFISVENVTTS